MVRATTATITSDAVVSSPAVGGPFLVVGLQLVGDGAGSTLVTVVPEPVRFAPGAGARLAPYGAALTPVNPGVAFLGVPAIGAQVQRDRPIRYWPMHVHEGRTGAVAVWVRAHGALLAPVVAVAVSIWSLEDTLEGVA